MFQISTRNNRQRRGSVIVEAALLFPLLIFITMGIFEYGWMILKAHELTSIAEQAARLESLPDANTASVNSAVQSLMTNMGLTYQAPVYTLATIAGTNQQLLTVTLTTPYPKLTNFPLLPLPANLTTTVTMTQEGP